MSDFLPTIAPQNQETVSVVRSNSKAGEFEARYLRAGIELYHDWQQAYDHFNAELWDNRLPDAIIMRMRHRRALGYFSPDRFQRINGRVVAEVSMNLDPSLLVDHREALSTLVHEMAHVWRHYLGPVNRNGQRVTNGYHDLK